MVPGPSYLQEPKGASYLAYDARNPDDLHDCPQKHKMKYCFTNVKHLIKYNCGKCNDQFFYNSDFGMEGCEQCSYFLCGSCSGVKRAKVSDTFGIELVSHFAEAFATEAQECPTCWRNYVKTYACKDFIYRVKK